MISQHVGKGITEEQRTRWVEMLYQNADDAMLSNDAGLRAAFVAYLEWGSRIGEENSQQFQSHNPKDIELTPVQLTLLVLGDSLVDIRIRHSCC
jgi:hypothetical protein